jgi:hypothetical protein
MDYAELDTLIESLQTSVEDSDPQKGYWKALWALVGEIGSGFKETRYPTKEDKDKAWTRFQELVARTRARSEEVKTRVTESQRKWERCKERSRRTRNDVQSIARSSRPTTLRERALSDVILLPLTLIRRIIEDLVGINDLDRLEEIRHELVKCNEKLLEAWNEFNEHKRDLLPGDKNETFQSLQEAREKLNEGWRQWKEAKNALYNKRHQEWEQRQREREARRVEREEKHRLFVERVEANIEKLEDKLSNSKSALERQEAHLDDLQSKYLEAWSDGFRETCTGWIEEAETRIASIKEHIERLEGWIEQERKKLR